jgi:hypothetical protein
MKSIRSLTLSCVGLLGLALFISVDTASAAPKRYSFKKGQLVKVTGKYCGLIDGKWTGVKKSGKSYVIDGSAGSRCKKLLKPGFVKNRGITALPVLAGIVKQRTSPARSAAVSGTPPTLSEIPAIVKNLFWINGEVDAIGSGSPNGEQCDDFFHGNADGDSSGLLGCAGVESVGRAFQSVLDGAASTCYMSRVATTSAFASGGIEVIDGRLPGGSITKLFSAPDGASSRTVKVTLSGFPGGGNQTGFLVIDSQEKLARDGNQYGYTAYFCNSGSSTPTSYERATVTLDGRFKLGGYNRDSNHEFKNQVEAALTQSGSSIIFDLSKSRVAKAEAEDEAGNRFKVQVSVNPDDTIDSKVTERTDASRRKIVSTARFTGTDIATLRVAESASKARFDENRRDAAFEYRDSAYVSAPTSALLTEISESALDGTFFETEGEVEPNFSGKSCSADADVTLRLDFTVPALAAIAQECETKRLEDQSFCFSNTDIGLALTQFPLQCGG